MNRFEIDIEPNVADWLEREATRRGITACDVIGQLLHEASRRSASRDDALYEEAMNDWLARERRWCSDGSSYPKRDDVVRRVRSSMDDQSTST